jgi:lipopolysaccharide transport system ATP-binding protein
MSDVVIRVENLSKRYRIGERAPYLTLRDAITHAVSSPFRSLSSPSLERSANNHIWALRDVSFEVRRGEVIGIIGRNGAGKSTLLKILSRVTKPTHGRARIRGRLGSLLEVGTGFHPELTGRENIYMNGAILGMSKREIALRFDEIVAFSEIERFIDTPVKYFSSGMYVRLAFSIAAHLEPDILIVDEVLAVGDVAFQKKCLGRMGGAAREGRTVLFVSHNMSAVALLCKSAIVLEQGRIRSITDGKHAIAEYLAASMDHDTAVYNVENSPRLDPSLGREVEFLRLELDGFPAKLVPADADLTLLMTIRGNQAVNNFCFNLTIYATDRTPVGSCSGSQVHSIQAGEVAEYRLELPNPRLAPGPYCIDLGLAVGNERTGFRQFDVVTDVLHFEVLPPPGEDGTISEWQQCWGMVRFRELVTARCERG